MRTYLITGANSGLGFETAKNIAKESNDNQIILAARSEVKLKEAATNLINETGNQNITYKLVDLSSLSSVDEFCNIIIAENILLDCIICNAGINGSFTGLSVDGYDIVFQTNHLSHMKLVTKLITNVKDNGRIIMVSSDMHNPPNTEMKWLGSKLLAKPNEHLENDTIRYSYSKLCNLYFTYYLADKLKRDITINAFNPGLLIDTNFSTDKSRFTADFLKIVEDRIGKLDISAHTLFMMATSYEFHSVNGLYVDRDNIVKSSELSYNQKNMKELWDYSKKLINHN